MNDLKRPLIAVRVGVGGSVGPIDRKQTFQDCLSLFRVKLVVLTARFRSIPESRQFQSRSALRICAETILSRSGLAARRGLIASHLFQTYRYPAHCSRHLSADLWAAELQDHASGILQLNASLTSFSAYKRVIADVAIFPVRGRRGKCSDARRRNADTAVNMTGVGGGARIGVFCVVPRGYMALASHSGSCEHGCGNHCSR